MLVLDLNTGPLAVAWRENTVGALYEIAKRAPGETVTMLLGTERVLLLQDMQHARHVLRESGATYRKNFGGFRGLFGESRLTSDGAHWEFLQSLSQPHIGAARPAQVVAAAANAFADAAEEIVASGDANTVVTVDQSIDRAAARVISEVAFGEHGIDIQRATVDMREMLRFGLTRTWDLGGALTPEDPQARASFEMARERLTGIIAGALPSRGGTDQSSALVRDIEAGETNGCDPIAELSSLLFAGFDTTASAIGWALFLLATMPDLQTMLRQKVRDHLAGAAPTLENLEAVPELAAFQNEVLRIFPPVPILGRIAEADDAVGELRIAKNQRVVISIVGMHHNSKVFPAPAQVRLQRQVDGRSQPQHMAFGGGRRGCAGSRIANLEMVAGLAVLIDAVEFHLPDQAPLQFDFAASIRRRGGHRLLVRRAA